MNLSPAIASTIAAIVTVPLFMALMRRVKSFRHVPDSDKTFTELAREYARWELGALLLTVLFVSLITLLLWQVLQWIYTQQMLHLEPSRYLVMMPSIVWAIPAFFFAIFLSALPQHYIFRGLLGNRRYAEYTEYGNQKFQINSWKLFKYLGNIMLPLCLAFTFLALDNYVRITDRTFVVNRFLGIGETAYRFEQIEAVILFDSFIAPGGDVVRNPHYVIRFDDGTEYNFRTSFSETDIGRQHEIAHFLAGAGASRISNQEVYSG